MLLLNRFTIQEVVAQLEASEDFWSADIYITPPECGENTDEDSGDEDSGLLDNLTAHQLVAEATVTKKVGGERIDIGDEWIETERADDKNTQSKETRKTNKDTASRITRKTRSFNNEAPVQLQHDTASKRTRKAKNNCTEVLTKDQENVANKRPRETKKNSGTDGIMAEEQQVIAGKRARKAKNKSTDISTKDQENVANKRPRETKKNSGTDGIMAEEQQVIAGKRARKAKNKSTDISTKDQENVANKRPRETKKNSGTDEIMAEKQQIIAGKRARKAKNNSDDVLTQDQEDGELVGIKRKWGKQRLQEKSKIWEEKKPLFLEQEWSPLGLFELFFDEDLLEVICAHTITYTGQQGNHKFTITVDEIRSFMAILLTSGYAVLPRRRMYWEQNEDVGNIAISSAMSRNRFDEILQYLHLVDNTLISTTDKFSKVRLLFAHLNERFLLYNPAEQKLSIDESMIPYYGRHGCKQFIRGKPIRFGYKVWCLNTSSGYMIQSEPYQGAGTNNMVKGLGMGGSVVVDLLSELPSDTPYEVYFDNLFTSLKLMDVLSQKGIRATGTIRVNRIEDCTITDATAMGKKARGTYDFCCDSANNVTVVHWHDNSVVTLASNCYGVEPVMKARRWSAAEKKFVEVPQPHVVHTYNVGMGGVDRMDQNVSCYRISIRSKKWWWPLFAYMVDVAVQNAWILYKRCPSFRNRPLALLDFRREISQVYLKRISAERVNRQMLSGHRVPLDRRVHSDVRFDGKHHYPESSDTQIRCGMCHGKVKYKCGKCSIGLHINCFALYHGVQKN